MRRTIVAFLLVSVFWGVSAHADDIVSENPALLQADTFRYDDVNQVFTASGRVELEQDGQIVKADQMIYNRQTDQVFAEGNVIFIDKQGQTYFAKRVQLTQKLKKGLVEQVGLVFPDGSRFAAREGEQLDENHIELRNAVYSPCNLCKEDPRKAPLWQLRAGKVMHDKEKQDVIYHNAKMEVRGVPVVYTPYFSHPDPSVRARSGLLVPKFSSDSKKGLMLRNYYYHTFSPQTDMMFEATTTQRSGGVVGAEWRHHFDKGKILFQGSLNRSTIRGGDDDDEIIESEKTRGHFVLDGDFDLNEKWRTGFNIRRTSDDFYLRDFDYDNADILQNRLYVQRFSGRNYTDISAYYFQDLRPDINQEQPDILPFVSHDMTGAPNAALGGRWALENDLVTLFRSGEQSVSRLSVNPSWERQDILPFGIKTRWQNKLRADNYWVRQGSPFDTVPTDSNVDETVSRFTPSSHLVTSLPMVRPSGGIIALIEPKAALTVMPNSHVDESIPNEDSRDVQIDMSNLFNDSRYPGADRIETGSHASYGVKVGGYDSEGNSTFLTLGQSYRLTEANPFPAGSGLERQRSDLVGQYEVTAYDRFYLDYRFQLNEQDFDDRRHELQALYMGDDVELRTNYVFAQEVQGTGLLDDRQQLGFEAAKALTPKWTAAVDTLHDLSGESGLLKAGMALQYKNECLRFSLRGERDLTDRETGGSDSRVLFSLGLRNLGGYDTPLLSDDPLYKPFGRDKNL